MMPDVRSAQTALEASLVRRADEIESRLAASLAGGGGGVADKARARDMLESFAVAAAEETTQKWWDSVV